MLPNTNPFGFAPPHNILAQPLAAQQMARSTGMFPINTQNGQLAGSAMAPGAAGAAMGAFNGASESPPTVDPAQFGIAGQGMAPPVAPGPGPEVNNPMPTPGVRPTGVMPMNPTPPPAMHVQNQMIRRLRGVNPNNGKPY